MGVTKEEMHPTVPPRPAFLFCLDERNEDDADPSRCAGMWTEGSRKYVFVESLCPMENGANDGRGGLMTPSPSPTQPEVADPEAGSRRWEAGESALWK